VVAGEKQKINFLKEDVRYLSPSNNQSAADIDSEIASTIQQAYAIARE
jgi:ATP-dependent Zn protease